MFIVMSCWFKAFRYTTNTRSSLKPLLDILLLPWVMKILWSPIPSCFPTGNKWSRYWSDPTQGPGCGSWIGQSGPPLRWRSGPTLPHSFPAQIVRRGADLSSVGQFSYCRDWQTGRQFSQCYQGSHDQLSHDHDTKTCSPKEEENSSNWDCSLGSRPTLWCPRQGPAFHDLRQQPEPCTSAQIPHRSKHDLQLQVRLRCHHSSTGHSYQYGPSGSMAARHQHGFQWARDNRYPSGLW